MTGRVTTAAHAMFPPPTGCVEPAAQRWVAAPFTPERVPPHPATRGARSVTTATQKITRTVNFAFRSSHYIENIMATTSKMPKVPHRHTRVTMVFVGQRSGIPYELERTTCNVCRAVLAERALRRTAA
jgi:hypothetical protein